jgi:basic amino acid/polyamine antiporter, APA family
MTAELPDSSASAQAAAAAAPDEPTFAKRLGAFDATMIVMGGIIGAGIFVNPSVVARQVHTPTLVLGAWVIGGAIALIGAFVYAELAVLRPRVGGQYAYLRDAYHPIVAFLYGWTLLLVIQTGGMAGAAIIFGRYFRELTGSGVSEQAVAAITLGALTLVNCFGVRAGSNVQSALMLTKLAAIALLIGVGVAVAPAAAPVAAAAVTPTSSGGAIGLATAMVPVLFAYGGWQTASFVSGEMRDPRRDLPRGLLIGVVGVIVLYLAVTWVCLRALGVSGLAATATPASEVMRRFWGDRGGRLIALGIALSTVGFLSQSILTAPRVYYAMARDGVFFQRVGTLDPRTRVPVVAIVLQGVWAAVIALTGKYDQILNYVVAIDVLFFGLTGAALIVFRRREAAARAVGAEQAGQRSFRVPGHPVTTALFVIACWAISATTVARYPGDAGIGVIILVLGILVYQYWNRRAGPRRPAAVSAR